MDAEERRAKARLWLAMLANISSGVSARAVAETGLRIITAFPDDEEVLEAIEEMRALHGDAAVGAAVDALELVPADIINRVRAAEEEARELEAERAYDASRFAEGRL